MAVPAAPIGVGVIGLGRAGCWHLERFRLSEHFSVLSGCDECSEAARRAAGLAPFVTETRRTLLDDPRIDLVVVSTPPATHAALAIEALAAGKHVLVETPCGLNSFEIESLAEAERRSGRSVIVAHHRRCDADFRLALDCLASGEIGAPTRMKFVQWRYSLEPGLPIPAGHFPNSGPEAGPLVVGHWRDDIRTGGGALWESGVHRFDQLLLLARDEPVAVYARTDFRPPDPVDTGFLALIQFASGLEAHIEVNRGIAAPLETGWTIAGSRGSYAGETRFTVTDEGEIVDVPLMGDPVRDDFHRALARYLRRIGPNPAPLAEARKGIELIEAVRESSRTGQPVVLKRSGN